MCALLVAVRTPNGGTDEVGRAGVPGEANRIDCVGVINGANLSFGYRTVVGTDLPNPYHVGRCGRRTARSK
jgi:hypothetical protein